MHFHVVFTRTSGFEEQVKAESNRSYLCVLEVTVQEIIKLMENLDARIVQGPDGISNWVLRVNSWQIKYRKLYCSKIIRRVKVPLQW